LDAESAVDYFESERRGGVGDVRGLRDDGGGEDGKEASGLSAVEREVGGVGDLSVNRLCVALQSREREYGGDGAG
jgi:hypothetical protein